MALSDQISIKLVQFNPVVGAIDENARRMVEIVRGCADDTTLVVFPEMALLGYPAEDMVLKPDVQRRCHRACEEMAQALAEAPPVIIGAPLVDQGKLYNAAVLLEKGVIKAWRAKHDLPDEGVFDDSRVFDQGPIPGPVAIGLASGETLRLGVMVCEDVWHPDVTEGLEESGAELLLVINGSPYDRQKHERRISETVSRVTESGLPLIYLNMVGGQDELVFDGTSFALDADCRLRLLMNRFVEETVDYRLERGTDGQFQTVETHIVPLKEGLAADYEGAMLGLSDYMRKNGFPGVLIGLSGGIDSALTAAIAVDALGPDRVRTVAMPSPFTSQESLDDAAAVASALDVGHQTIGIQEGMQAFDAMLQNTEARGHDLTQQNIQARLRGMILMSLSNASGWMVMTTGNKSEVAVGYSTLYGDMCGGYSVLKDIYKMDVFAMSAWRNAHHPAGALGPQGPVMPERVITKPPSAELKPDQKDSDSLPDYPILDRILQGLIEQDRSVEDLVGEGIAEADVRKTQQLLDIAEYKRRQSAPGVKLTPRAFGRDRRYPITNGYRKLV